MKYKKIIEDKIIDQRIDNLKRQGITKAFIARKLGKSRQYMNEVFSGKFAIEEDLYQKLKRIL